MQNKTWADADRISDRIVALLREEFKRPGFSPVQMFAGQMLAMMAMLKTAEGLALPESLAKVKVAIRLCLADMMQESRSRSRSN